MDSIFEKKVNTPQISVIIPAFNCDEYLKECIISIINQTYENLEIVIVNDGSIDKTQEICETFSKQDRRIHLINKKNEGVAIARNTGVKYATSKYITFVDADDILHPSYVEFLYQLLKKNEADIAVCGIRTFYNNYVQENKDFQENEEPVYELTGIQALEKMLYRKGLSVSPCVKLVKREILENHLFPPNTLFEDLAVVYKWFAVSDKVVFCLRPLYYYRIRKGSRQHSKFNLKKLDLINVSENILHYVENECPEIVDSARNRLFVSCLQILRDIPVKLYPDIYKGLKRKIISLRRKILLDSKANKTTRLLAFLCYMNIRIMKSLGAFADSMIYRLRIRKTF